MLSIGGWQLFVVILCSTPYASPEPASGASPSRTTTLHANSHTLSQSKPAEHFIRGTVRQPQHHWLRRPPVIGRLQHIGGSHIGLRTTRSPALYSGHHLPRLRQRRIALAAAD